MIQINGDRVRVEVARRGWTLADLARAMCRSRQQVHWIVTHPGRLHVATVHRVCLALRCEVDDLQRAPTQAEWAMLGRARA